MAIQVDQYNFGVGNLWLIPNITNPTPLLVGALQEVSAELSTSNKELRGANLFPLDVARYAGKCEGKAKCGSVRTALIAGVFGSSVITGSRIGVPAESTGTISGATYTVTNTTGFSDLGVWDENGVPLTRVASAPTATEYAVTTGGVYTFNAGANGKIYTIAYCYTASTGYQTTITNTPAGAAAYFKIEGYGTYMGNPIGFRVYKATISKVSMPFKNDDHTLTDFDFSGMQDASGNVFSFFSVK